jgi:hypothetical protein
MSFISNKSTEVRKNENNTRKKQLHGQATGQVAGQHI